MPCLPSYQHTLKIQYLICAAAKDPEHWTENFNFLLLSVIEIGALDTLYATINSESVDYRHDTDKGLIFALMSVEKGSFTRFKLYRFSRVSVGLPLFKFRETNLAVLG